MGVSKVDHDYPFALVQSPIIYRKSSVPNTPGEEEEESKVIVNQQPMTSSKRQLYLWIAYNVFLYGLIVVSGAILFMVMVGMVHVGDKNAKDDWIEVNSQILNGVFTWMAFTNHPFFLYRLVKTIQVLGIRRWNWVSPLPKRIQAARYLSRHFPLVFVDTVQVQEHKLEGADAQDDDGEVYLLTEHEETETVEEISYCRGDAENLRNTFVMLNWNCLFQYPITAVMWAYNSDTRPGFVIGVFLPLSFLCNFGGQYRIFKLNKDIKTRRSAAVGGPIQQSIGPTSG